MVRLTQGCALEDHLWYSRIYSDILVYTFVLDDFKRCRGMHSLATSVEIDLRAQLKAMQIKN